MGNKGIAIEIVVLSEIFYQWHHIDEAKIPGEHVNMHQLEVEPAVFPVIYGSVIALKKVVVAGCLMTD